MNLVTIVIFSIIFQVSFAQLLHCNYRYGNNFVYTCDLSIHNPNGFNNFTRIEGTHLFGLTNQDVRNVQVTHGSLTTNIPSIICDTLSQSTTMELGFVGVERIDVDSFRNCRNLRHVDLNENRISRFHEDSFRENSELRTLFLWRIGQAELPEILFANNYMLDSLFLDNNNYTDLPANIFNSLQNLTRLDLSRNRFSTLRIEWFARLDNLRILDLYNNELMQLPLNIFDRLTNLESLSLSRNPISTLHENIFARSSNLQNLHLFGNQLSSLPQNIFRNNINITILSLRENQFEVFPRNIFSPLQNLLILELQRNRLKVIHSSWFGTLPSLLAIYFNDNQIDAVDERLVDNTSIQAFDMRGNLCSTAIVMDNTPSRETMRMQMRRCFDNYDYIGNDCPSGNLPERVCTIEEDNKEQQNTIEGLLNAVEELQRQVQELINRPCTCS